MKRLTLIAFTTLAALAVASCSKIEPLSPYTDTARQMTMTAQGDNVVIFMGGSGKTTIDWGDGSVDTYIIRDTLPYGFHSYSDAIPHAITIKSENITYLQCSGGLTALDVSKNTALTQLWCGGNQLTTLDVSKNAALTELECIDNQLAALNLSGVSALMQLQCDKNQLTALDVSNNLALTGIFCNNNQLTSLDVSKNPALTTLYCDYNQLTSLNIENNLALTRLSCPSNKLATLDLSGAPTLTVLYCDSNRLATLDLSRNPALRYLYCPYNPLQIAALNDMFGTLPDSYGTNWGNIYLDYNQGMADISIATAKGWTVIITGKHDDP